MILVRHGQSTWNRDHPIQAQLDPPLSAEGPRQAALLTHGGVIQVALHRGIGRPSTGLFPFKIQNASISVIEAREGRMVIAGSNDVAHLEPALVTEPGPG